MKKSTILTIIAIGVLALGTGFYFAWQKSRQAAISVTVTPVPGSEIQVPSTTGEITGNLTAISKNAVINYWIMNATSTTATSTSLIFYITANGNIFKINGNKEEIVSDLQINNLRSIKVSADGKVVLIKSGSGDNLRFDIYDSSRNVWLQPILGIIAADLSPDGKQIVYLTSNGQKSAALMTQEVGASKKKPSQILSINQIDFDLKWLETNRILFIPKSSVDYQSEIWQVDVRTKTLSQLMSANGLMVNWAKLGETAVRFFSIGRDYTLDFIDNKGNVRGVFQFKTLPDKCFIASPTQIYCAIPRDQEVFSRLIFPDDYLKRAIYFQDSVYLIDFAQNQFHPLFDADEPTIDAINLSILNNNQLLFINRYDGKLYGLEIK
ncbi:hypothetical protein HZB05_02945 [Candidatus Wolfebacteria bacterium]|nr:hypothetical protein [Candidatus Wolfebacteria bacterium]